jgi:oligopeptide transport system substrate-binding protein
VANDFIESYRRLLSPGFAAPKAALFFMVKNAEAFSSGQQADFSAVGFRAVSERALEITLERPTPAFLLYVASGAWIPVNPRVASRHDREWTRPENHVGNGPFTLAEWRPHQRIVVKRNPNFHSPDMVKLDELHFVVFDSGDTEDRAYRAGQIDITMSVPTTKLEPYARERPTELHRAPLAETRYLTFNTSRAPLNDVRVRRALALSIDRKQLTERVLRGGQEPARHFVSSILLPPEKSNAPAPESDPTEARKLLAAAGYPEGKGFPRLELASWPIGTPILESIQDAWKKELGIDVALVTREAKVHLASLRDGQYDIGFITAIPDIADAGNLLAEFVTAAPSNYPRWSDHGFDQAMRAAARDPAMRSTHLRQAEERLLQEVPVFPLYFNAKNWLMSSRVRGWQYDALWTRFYLNVELTKN